MYHKYKYILYIGLDPTDICLRRTPLPRDYQLPPLQVVFMIDLTSQAYNIQNLSLYNAYMEQVYNSLSDILTFIRCYVCNNLCNYIYTIHYSST